MNEKILLIDDEPDILDSLSTILKGERYQVYPVAGGEEAVKIFKSDPFDLVITDNRMPGMNGIEVIKKVKQLDENVEVIVMTGFATIENAVQALKEDGAFDYLTKPFEDIEGLLITVKRALERRKLRLENKALFEELKQEVEERKQTEIQLLQSKTTLQSVFDGISEPLMMLDQNMSVKVLNKAAKEYSQASSYQDILGRPCYMMLAGKSTPCRECKFHLAILSKNAMTFERNGLKNPLRMEEVVIYPLQNVTGSQEGAIVRISDITEQKKIEEQLIRADRLSSLAQLSGGIAHEIRNPLASIRLFADILGDEDKFDRTDQEIEIIDEIKDNLNRIDDIIKRVLDFAKPPVLSSNKVDLNALIQESARLWSAKLRKADIKLKLNLKNSLPPVQADALGLQQIINNVVLNAIEAMDRGGDIGIKTSKDVSSLPGHSESVFIKVSDTGPGIVPELQEDIFNPFFTTKSTGTGLGLSISHQIIKRHGGAFSLESNPGEGTTFIVELPLVDTKKKNSQSNWLERSPTGNS